VIERLPNDEDLVSAVERDIANSMNQGLPDIEAIRAQLGMGARTLQRRLAEREPLSRWSSSRFDRTALPGSRKNQIGLGFLAGKQPRTDSVLIFLPGRNSKALRLSDCFPARMFEAGVTRNPSRQANQNLRGFSFLAGKENDGRPA
jgi:hypothetical protein